MLTILNDYIIVINKFIWFNYFMKYLILILLSNLFFSLNVSMASGIKKYYCKGGKHTRTFNNEIKYKLDTIPNIYLTWYVSHNTVVTSTSGYYKENASFVFKVNNMTRDSFIGHEPINKKHIVELKNNKFKQTVDFSSKNYQSKTLNLYSCKIKK